MKFRSKLLKALESIFLDISYLAFSNIFSCQQKRHLLLLFSLGQTNKGILKVSLQILQGVFSSGFIIS